MKQVQTCIEIILPFLLLTGLGYFLRRLRIMTQSLVDGIQKLSFKVLLPAISFRLAWTADLRLFQGQWKLLIWGCGFLVTYAAVVILILWRGKLNAWTKAEAAMGMVVNNIVMFGLPITTMYYQGQDMSPITALLTLAMPLSYLLGVLVLHCFTRRSGSAGQIVRGIVSNPILIALLLGYLCNWIGLRLPDVVDETLQSLSAVNTPLVFLCIGASISFRLCKNEVHLLLTVLVVKLVLSPALAIAGAVLLGFRGCALFSMVTIFANPSAASSFSLIRGAGGEGKHINSMIMYSNLCSLVTILLCIIALKSLALV